MAFNVFFCFQVKQEEGANVFDEAESMDISEDEQTND